MIIKNLTQDEQTIPLEENDDVQVDGVMSFQNTSPYSIRWSTIPFSASNYGAILDARQERVFSDAKTVYFKKIPLSAFVHCRAVAL